MSQTIKIAIFHDPKSMNQTTTQIRTKKSQNSINCCPAKKREYRVAEMGVEGMRVDDVALDAIEAESEGVPLDMLDLVDHLRLRRRLHRLVERFVAVSFVFQNRGYSPKPKMELGPPKNDGPITFFTIILFYKLTIYIFFSLS